MRIQHGTDGSARTQCADIDGREGRDSLDRNIWVEIELTRSNVDQLKKCSRLTQTVPKHINLYNSEIEERKVHWNFKFRLQKIKAKHRRKKK